MFGVVQNSESVHLRNNHRSEQLTSVPAALKQRNKGRTARDLQLGKATYSGDTSPLVYLNLPCVLVQVARFLAVYHEVLEMA